MALPYDTKVVLPFDIATAQDMNERHANDVALAAGTGLNDGAVTADKIDFTTFASFRATRSTSLSIPAHTDTAVVFNSTIYNVGNGYDNTTGGFTAPVDGVYQFSFGIYAEGASNSRATYFYTGTVPTARRGGDRSQDTIVATAGFLRLQQSCEVAMKAGETLYLRAFLSATTNIGGSHDGTFFAGHLVHMLPPGVLV